MVAARNTSGAAGTLPPNRLLLEQMRARLTAGLLFFDVLAAGKCANHSLS